MPKGKKSDKIAQKKKNYQVLEDGSKGNSPESIPVYACDKKRCLNGRCGSCWMVILGLGIAVGIFFILYLAGVVGFSFSTDGSDTLYEVLAGTDEPTSSPTADPTVEPTFNPSYNPTVSPTTGEPTTSPTADPTGEPTLSPSDNPTVSPTTAEPTASPTADPTGEPTSSPSDNPTVSPTYDPTVTPTANPTGNPTSNPTADPTSDPTTPEPTMTPTLGPTNLPTLDPTSDPTAVPTTDPTNAPTTEPTLNPTGNPTTEPTLNPTGNPTTEPTIVPTADPTTSEPTTSPTYDPTSLPTYEPTYQPTADPTSERRRGSDADFTSNILFVIADGTVFNYTEFPTPVVDEFLREGYTFNNVKQRSVLASSITGKTAIPRSAVAMNQGVGTLAEKLRSKGYINYYYGSWMDNSEFKASTPLKQGWNFSYETERQQLGADFKMIITDEDVIMEKVQSRLQMINDERWTITVNWTISRANNGVEVNGSKTPIGPCSRYFQVGGAEFNYHRGLSCQVTIGHDATFGKVLETLKTTGLWMKTIVVFVITGQRKNVFSMSGGALPANLLNRTNEYPYSMQDIVFKILSISGFSDLELGGVKLEGFPVFGMNQLNF